MNHILPSVLEELKINYDQQPQRIIDIWPEIIGKKLAPMAKAVSFNKGILTVIVKSSTLYSLLGKQEKIKIIKKLQNKLEKTKIRDIVFRVG